MRTKAILLVAGAVVCASAVWADDTAPRRPQTYTPSFERPSKPVTYQPKVERPQPPRVYSLGSQPSRSSPKRSQDPPVRPIMVIK